MNDESKPKSETSTNEPSPSPVAKKFSSWLPVFALCGVFLLGFVPMWFKSHRLSNELFRAEQHARTDLIQITFANAVLDARRGNYEPARQEMTKFFSLVTAESGRGLGSTLPVNVSEQLKPLLAQRDELITLLARGDPASAERLANAYEGFQKAVGN